MNAKDMFAETRIFNVWDSFLFSFFFSFGFWCEMRVNVMCLFASPNPISGVFLMYAMKPLCPTVNEMHWSLQHIFNSINLSLSNKMYLCTQSGRNIEASNNKKSQMKKTNASNDFIFACVYINCNLLISMDDMQQNIAFVKYAKQSKVFVQFDWIACFMHNCRLITTTTTTKHHTSRHTHTLSPIFYYPQL